MKIKVTHIALFILIMVFGSVSTILLTGLLLYNAGDEPFPAEMVFILAGKSIRALEAADLYKKGLVKKIYVSNSVEKRSKGIVRKMGIKIPTHEWVTKQVLFKKGVPEADIEEFGNKSLSTVEEALVIRKLLGDNQVKFLVVTSPGHAWRAKMIFSDYFDEHEFGMVANKYEPIPYPWWTNQSAAINVILETSKVIFYQLGGRFLTKATK